MRSRGLPLFQLAADPVTRPESDGRDRLNLLIRHQAQPEFQGDRGQ